ncbi:PREDICTED: uncharacterized protein LOC106117794 [Papilio xuthus]|uniref:Uncharacterized protein LOC106117794 n=1 Tax=Papilio xuthus TaxID=66420 RepID=A0AAJ7E933_PAPXU|nr:PREDICTED: uncharacterized protein LOC106117794 [Papilio xuthus]
MDLTVDQFMEGLLSKQSYDTPSDTVSHEQLEMKLPEWFDEKLFKKGQRFYCRFCFGISYSMLTGLVALFAIPTILEVLAGSRRSSTKYTAYKRYVATFLHIQSWYTCELKPGSVSWKSLTAVRSAHIKNGRAARLKKKGTVSQRDVALTLFSLVGPGILKPDRFGIRQLEADDWEAYNHYWAVIGYMLGLEDRYNVCRRNIYETRQVFQLLLDRVFVPCLENVPEYFEHMARVMMDGLWAVMGATESDSLMYITKNLFDVPGFIIFEGERINLQRRLREQLGGKHKDTGVDVSTIIEKSCIDGLPDTPPRLLYLKDYESLETSPEYKKLSYDSKFKLGTLCFIMSVYSTTIGRVLLNWYYRFSMFMTEYLPYVAFFLYGIKKSYVDMFKDPDMDSTPPKPNSWYNNRKPEPWYKTFIGFW